jgi:hypothetical protein
VINIYFFNNYISQERKISLERKMLPIHKVVERLRERIGELPLGDPIFGDIRYESVKLDPKNFHPIKSVESSRKICYVDGGNVQIIKAPNFIVELTRLYFCIFKSGKRITPHSLPQRIEFFTVCYAKAEKDRIKYETEFIPVRDEWSTFLPDVSDLKFDSFDETIMLGRQRASIDRVSDSARSFEEWNMATFVIEQELDENDILVRDGSLQTFVTNESKYARKAYNMALRKNVIFSGLSKTSSLFTTTGYPLLASISELAESAPLKDESWYYHPIVKITHPDHRAEMFAVKLHPTSRYVFRYEILRDQAQKMSLKEVNSIIGTLSANSCDICFPGYPYGLIKADSLARISSRERDSQQIQFMSASASAGIWKWIEKYVKCIDAHELLNKLAGE